ncbi:hypothetical protein LSCM1_05292 [Leishmania martiniquensis]|uniref:Uncharacterized protein n=1 Tax=Leishmania martiniquensis TaxID=1580590 RepID=A0A836H8L2_9TRYP|nr:hypothetical protein LSCM1_05292 [Leishmania martiniquensis]
MAVSKTVCRACLAAYAAFMLTITTVYLWRRSGVLLHLSEVREELPHGRVGRAEVEGNAFADSGGAEYIFVACYLVLHLISLPLFLFGHKSGVKMVVGCALLVSCAVIYIVAFGSVILHWRLEQLHQQRSLVSSETVAALQAKQEGPQPYRLEADYMDSATALAGAAPSLSQADQREVSRASAKGRSGSWGKCGAAQGHAGEPFSYGSLGWAVLESLADVLAAIIGGPGSTTDDGSIHVRSDGAPFSGIFRLSLLLLNCGGFALSMWGAVLFNGASASTYAPAPISNAELAASALSQSSALVDSEAPAALPAVQAKKHQ